MENEDELKKNNQQKEENKIEKGDKIKNDSSKAENSLINVLKKVRLNKNQEKLNNDNIESKSLTNIEANKTENKDINKISNTQINDIKEENTINENELKEENNNINKDQEKNEIKLEKKQINEYINVTEDEGIKKKIIKEGQGSYPKEGNEVTINYIGIFNNQIFEQSNEDTPTSFIIGENKVIKGWELALKTMKLGEKSEFIMKPEYTYGDKQINENIHPTSILTYEIELKSIH